MFDVVSPRLREPPHGLKTRGLKTHGPETRAPETRAPRKGARGSRAVLTATTPAFLGLRAAVPCPGALDVRPPVLPWLGSATGHGAGREPRGMSDRVPADVTAELEAVGRGDREAYDRLMALLYDELRMLARRERNRHRKGMTLDTTGLVHEAYLKLAGREGSWENRAHFLAVAAKVMRHLLVDAARARLAQRRGGGKVVATLPDDLLADDDGQAEHVLAVETALDRLRAIDERLVGVVECRFYGGMTEEETAAALGISARTVRRDWLRAKGWLRRDLERDAPPLEVQRPSPS